MAKVKKNKFQWTSCNVAIILQEQWTKQCQTGELKFL